MILKLCGGVATERQREGQKKIGKMDRYFSTVKRKSPDKSGNGDDDQLPNPKSRKYDDAYLSLGFTVNVVGEEKRPFVFCA